MRRGTSLGRRSVADAVDKCTVSVVLSHRRHPESRPDQSRQGFPHPPLSLGRSSGVTHLAPRSEALSVTTGSSAPANRSSIHQLAGAQCEALTDRGGLV